MLDTRKNLPSPTLVEAAMYVTVLNLWHCNCISSPGYNQTPLAQIPLVLNLQEFRYDLRTDSC